MDNTFHQQTSDTHRRRVLGAGLWIFDRLENWLAHILELTWLTEEEQESAGIHLGQLTDDEQVDAGIYPGDQASGGSRMGT